MFKKLNASTPKDVNRSGVLRYVLLALLLLAVYRIGWQIPSPHLDLTQLFTP